MGLVLLFAFVGDPLAAQTDNGELEGRAAPVARRKCVGGTSAGSLCNQDGGCPGSTCVDRNVFTLSVGVQFNATAAELDAIEDMITQGSAMLFDLTDGQAEIGAAYIYNNAFGTGSEPDVRIFPSTEDTWWNANTGSWQRSGGINVSINYIPGTGNLGEFFAHEFVHLVFDARDEYETRPAGCIDPATNDGSCPDAAAVAAGALQCIMDAGGSAAGDNSEMCWGHGDPADLTDLSGGPHDATDVTEQSRCRSNRSCWDQLIWSWPNTFLAPAAAPDPAANGLTVNPTNYLRPDNTARVVLVLDESGSMDAETPTRMERLRTAALDFVAIAESGTELGIVSYSDNAATASGRVNLPIAALGADRSDQTDAINGLDPDGYTNIGAGLQEAIDMITAAGGVTANTFIVLMTDGINNRPEPQATADADLQTKIDALLAAGIPVYVTCTGSDLGLSSQCAEIALGTGGFYVDAADAARLPEAFVDIYERTARRDAIGSYSTWTGDASGDVFYVEKGAESATFSLMWQSADGKAYMAMTGPDGSVHRAQAIPQGMYVKVDKPAMGDWKMTVDWSGSAPAQYVKRGYVANRVHAMAAGVRHPSVKPGEEIHVYAYPLSTGGSVTDTTKRITGTVIRPDGSVDIIELHDMGDAVAGGGDDIRGDGTFTGVYRKTDLKGDYQFLLKAEIDGWIPTEAAHERGDSRSPKFTREARLSAAVGDPNDTVSEPEDGQYVKEPGKEPCDKGWCRWVVILLVLLILLVLGLILRHRRR